MKTQNKALGEQGENIARDFLQRLGYSLVGQNIRTPYGEIDLVMRDKAVLVFVEVKTRRTHSYGSPLEAITPRKFTKMAESAEAYVQLHGQSESAWRLDVLGITYIPGQAEPRIEHVINAQL